jgi:hypothetical protein
LGTKKKQQEQQQQKTNNVDVAVGIWGFLLAFSFKKNVPQSKA